MNADLMLTRAVFLELGDKGHNMLKHFGAIKGLKSHFKHFIASVVGMVLRLDSYLTPGVFVLHLHVIPIPKMTNLFLSLQNSP